MEDYKPIDCNLYDYLEAWATTRKNSTVVYSDEGENKSAEGLIKDLYIKDKVEYMKLNDSEIRLDALLKVNDVDFSAGESCAI